MDTYSLDFLAWIDRILFLDTFIEEMQEFYDEPVELRLKLGYLRDKPEKCNIIRIWQEHCVGRWADEEFKTHLTSWLNKHKEAFDNH